ncbi:hypothetical protein B0H21DRAFT_693676 [Amylocystis lapponica]|nr:hypothetical protein B0H21DRAFT_693676 [Amylocystis lapponica]
MMQYIQDGLAERGIAFSTEGNRVRCFPHVVNVGVQTGLKQLTAVKDNAIGAPRPKDEPLPRPGDPVKTARSLVAACRAFGQRREEFRKTIQEGNSAKTFGEQPLPKAELLRDVDTHWSSMFLMIDRFLELCAAIQQFLAKQQTMSDVMPEKHVLDVLKDIRDFLEIPHIVQEVLSAERTPTLCMVLPAYENLMTALENLRSRTPKLHHAISATLLKLRVYYTSARQSDTCIIAMSESRNCHCIGGATDCADLHKHQS